ncbi:GNAT family N-acetyltransferase [Sphingobacterium deserti]|uniref:GCN5-like N-acetyltransferase n=1 Tax=Sphingobacterium deserti TaxID=1229276 RepID=A0A0B8T5A1_9SPHI|nr:GNAT family N-acetyltransferase [Sphingobacterium deserti]KGE12684.1 GCN5-like N-acetyltransferase [Sphingobacterium deserti]
MNITFSDSKEIYNAQILPLYQANGWSAATKPEALLEGLRHSHTLITAWHGEQLVGLGNAISDGYLVVYYPHLLVLPAFHGRGIGRQIMSLLQKPYTHFHMQMLTADAESVDFYKKAGFRRAGNTTPMWIYAGTDH